MKKILLNILYAIRCFLDRIFHFREVAILCYHSISEDAHETAVPPIDFAVHLAQLKKKGTSFVSLEDIIDWYENKRIGFPKKVIAVTFDDGYVDFETTALPILEKYAVPATLFVIGDSVESRGALKNNIPLLTQEAVKRLGAHPLITIGYHSKTHANLSKLAKADIVQEVQPPFPADVFAYPGGNYSEEAIQAVREAGYRAAFSIKRNLVRRGKSRWLLPRLVILKNDTPADIARYASVAQYWYTGIRRFF